ncbi:unnamed protein product, partial [marine sediment metagenome]
FVSREMLSKLNEDIQIPEINTLLDPENPQIETLIPDVYSILEDDSYNEDGQVGHLNKATELLKLEFLSSASLEIEAGSSEIEENPTGILEISTLFLQSNDYANSIRIIYKNFSRLKSRLNEPYIDYLYYLYYPYGYKKLVLKYSNTYNLNPLFTLAIIRQESSFMPDAGSYAGAQGLLQIIPSTGKSIANQIGLENFNDSMLLDPEISINMGTFYLRQQLDNFNQSKIYCLGAYNGGPGAMSDWISRWGDKDTEEFIENIPYNETRDYIKKVMGNYYFYQMLYD